MSSLGFGDVYSFFHNFHILRLSGFPYLIFLCVVGLTFSLVLFFKYGVSFLFLVALLVLLFVSFL